MENDDKIVVSVKQQLARLFEESWRDTVCEELESQLEEVRTDIAPLVDVSYADYTWRCSFLFRNVPFTCPESIANDIVDNLPASEMIASCSVSVFGFVNVVLSPDWIAKSIQQMLLDGIETWAPKIPVTNAIVNFSLPNMLEQMHFGDLRSTIIGDTVARMLEYSNVKVIRRNHVGDWGTQFGMIIEYLFETFGQREAAGELTVGDLETYYKASKQRFDSDPAFRRRAQLAFALLQAGELEYRNAWTQICKISQREFDEVYQRLGVHLEEGAAKLVGWLPAEDIEYPKANCLGFGLVLEGDAKWLGHNNEAVKMVDLLGKAKNKCEDYIIKIETYEEWCKDELDGIAEAFGCGAVKYDVLKNGLADYTFNFDNALNWQENTGVHVLYMHAMMCWLIRTSGKDTEELIKTGTIVISKLAEKALGNCLVEFVEVVEEACNKLLPAVLCEYLFKLSMRFWGLIRSHQVVGSDSAEATSRLLLCVAAERVMRKGLHLLGLTPVPSTNFRFPYKGPVPSSSIEDVLKKLQLYSR